MKKSKILIITFTIALASFATKAQNLNVTPLMDAVVNEDVKGVKFFSKSGGKKGLNEKNFGGATALHLAVRKNNEEIVTILITNGANVNAKDNEGFTPLMRAALLGNYQIMQLLISNGALPNYFNNSGESVIELSANSGCSKCLEILFSRFDFKQLMKPDIAKEQLEKAFLSGQKQQNDEVQKVASDYLNRILIEDETAKKRVEEERKPPEPILVIEKEVTTPTKEKDKPSIPVVEPELIEIENQTNQEQDFKVREMKALPQNPAFLPSTKDVKFLPKQNNKKIENITTQNMPKMIVEDEKMTGKKKQIAEDKLFYIPPFY